MKIYTKGTQIFCDFAFGGKPRAVCVAVLEPGDGQRIGRGKVRVRLKEAWGGLSKGTELDVPTCYAVPCAQEIRKSGSVFRWVNTLYQWK